jgi:tripartite-type tricarboxylate transporter receptor subunit TctC
MKLLCGVLFASSMAAIAQSAAAQSWPVKPIRMIVSNAPGGAPDTMSRLYSDRLATALGQPIIVDNRPAAGGIVAAEFVAKSAPDGYNLLSGGTAALAPAVVPNLPYDPINDFAGIAPLADIHAVVISGPSHNFKTLQELIAYGKANPGKLNFGSGGAGSPTHLSGERMRFAAGFDAVHIPQKGAAASVTEVMAGRLDFYLPPLVAAISSIRAGKIRALATPAAQRLALLPDVPTTAEAGVPNAVFQSGVGLWAPRRTPRDIINRLNQEILRIADQREVRDALFASGAAPWPLTPEQFDAFIRADSAQQQSLVKAAGIKAH